MVLKKLIAEIYSELLLRGGMSIDPMVAPPPSHGLAGYCRNNAIHAMSERKASFSGTIAPDMLLARDVPKKQGARGSGHHDQCDRAFQCVDSSP